jgi:hypothetical protein
MIRATDPHGARDLQRLKDAAEQSLRKDAAIAAAKAFVNLWLDFRTLPADDFRKVWGREYNSKDLVSLAVELRERLKELQ